KRSTDETNSGATAYATWTSALCSASLRCDLGGPLSLHCLLQSSKALSPGSCLYSRGDSLFTDPREHELDCCRELLPKLVLSPDLNVGHGVGPSGRLWRLRNKPLEEIVGGPSGWPHHKQRSIKPIAQRVLYAVVSRFAKVLWCRTPI